MSHSRLLVFVVGLFLVAPFAMANGPIHCADETSAAAASARLNTLIELQLLSARAEALLSANVEIAQIQRLDLQTYQERYTATYFPQVTHAVRTRFVLCAAVLLRTVPY